MYQQRDERGNPDDRETTKKWISNNGSYEREKVGAATDHIVDLGSINALYVEFLDQEYY